MIRQPATMVGQGRLGQSTFDGRGNLPGFSDTSVLFIPEPGSALLLALAASAMALRRLHT
jgi:hypothetical protein